MAVNVTKAVIEFMDGDGKDLPRDQGGCGRTAAPALMQRATSSTKTQVEKEEEERKREEVKRSKIREANAYAKCQPQSRAEVVAAVVAHMQTLEDFPGFSEDEHMDKKSDEETDEEDLEVEDQLRVEQAAEGEEREEEENPAEAPAREGQHAEPRSREKRLRRQCSQGLTPLRSRRSRRTDLGPSWGRRRLRRWRA